MLYTSNAIYAQLNKALRDENRSAVRKYFDYLRLFFGTPPPPPTCTFNRPGRLFLYSSYPISSPTHSLLQGASHLYLCLSGRLEVPLLYTPSPSQKHQLSF